MSTTRRDFLRTSVAAGGTLALGLGSPEPGAASVGSGDEARPREGAGPGWAELDPFEF